MLIGNVKTCVKSLKMLKNALEFYFYGTILVS